MVGWHHRLNGHEFGWTPGVGDGQGGVICISEVIDISPGNLDSSLCFFLPLLFSFYYYRVHGILQARILEWVVSPFSRGFSQPRDLTLVFHIAGGFFTS